MKKCEVLYIDPPWKYRNKKTGGSMKSGSSQKYPTMTLEEICTLDIKKIAEKNSILFLWVPTPLQKEGNAVIKAWHYKYITKIYWEKTDCFGMGYWFRGQVEELWLCIHGNVKAFRAQIKNIIKAKPGKHSEKPEEFRQLIEKVTAGKTKIEVFARKRHKGWSCLGFDTDGRDIKDIL